MILYVLFKGIVFLFGTVPCAMPASKPHNRRCLQGEGPDCSNPVSRGLEPCLNKIDPFKRRPKCHQGTANLTRATTLLPSGNLEHQLESFRHCIPVRAQQERRWRWLLRGHWTAHGGRQRRRLCKCSRPEVSAGPLQMLSCQRSTNTTP